MVLVVLYEVLVDDQPSIPSEFANAFVIPSVDPSREVFLFDIMQHLHLSAGFRQNTSCHAHYSYYALFNEDLLWLSSPSSVVPVSTDQCVRMLFKVTGLRPFMRLPQCYLYSDKARRVLYSAEDYHRTKAFAHRTFQECARAVPTVYSSSRSSSAVLSSAKIDGPQVASNTDVPSQRRSSNNNSSSRSSNSSATQHNSSPNDDAIASITDAAGVATKALFSFASTLSKSVLDIAQTSMAQVPATGGGSVKVGDTAQVGDKQVHILKQVAEGGFGTVYLAEDSSSGRLYAVKHLLCQSIEQLRDANLEVEALRRFDGCEHIISLVDYHVDRRTTSSSRPMSASNPTQALLLFPWYPHGTVWDRVSDAASSGFSHKWPFPEHLALRLVLGAARGLWAMHQMGYSHRDVKPHNMMLSGAADEWTAVLMDLGSVSHAVVDVRTKGEALSLQEEAACKTSAGYRSPELTSPPFLPFRIDERVDSWALGCCMYCIAFGSCPFETPRDGVLRLAILNGRYSIPSLNTHRDCVFSDGYVQLLQRLLAVDLTQRPHMDEVIHTCQLLLSALLANSNR